MNMYPHNVQSTPFTNALVISTYATFHINSRIYRVHCIIHEHIGEDEKIYLLSSLGARTDPFLIFIEIQT